MLHAPNIPNIHMIADFFSIFEYFIVQHYNVDMFQCLFSKQYYLAHKKTQYLSILGFTLVGPPGLEPGTNRL